jgi:alpha-beta hydrolase superfamily lysophospholipase
MMKEWGIFVIGLFIGYIVWIIQTMTKRKNDESDERRKSYFGKGYPIPENILRENYWKPNSRGMLIHQNILRPKHDNIRGVIMICHGFGDHTLDFVTEIALKFCSQNYAVITMDAEGHGLSDGLHGHIESVKSIASDYCDFLFVQSKRSCFQSKPFFIYGGSMGGAVAFYLSTIFPSKDFIKGVIFASPMVKIADDMRPHPLLTMVLRTLAYLFPFAPIVPLPSISHKCFKRQDNLQRSLACQLAYRKSPRLNTASQLLLATDEITKMMNQLTIPILIIHGEEDAVTCSKNSLLLYEKCGTRINEKRCHIYPGAWHSLLVGEEEPLASQIFEDILQWLQERIEQHS